MQNNLNHDSGMMSGYGSWPIVTVLLIAVIVVLLMRASNKK